MQEDNINKNKKANTILVIAFLAIIINYIPYTHAGSVFLQAVLAILVVYSFLQSEISLVAWVLLMTVTITYINQSTSATFTNYYGLSGTILCITLLVCVGIFLYKKMWKMTLEKPKLLISIFVLQMVLSKIYARTQEEYSISFFLVCVIYILFLFIIDDDNDIYLVKLSFAITGIVAVIGILPSIFSLGTIYDRGLLVDRNYQSGFILICILQSILLLRDYWGDLSRGWKIFVILGSIGEIVIIITSASRTAIICIVLATIIFILFNLKNGKRICLGVIIALIAYNIAEAYGMFDFLVERFTLSNIIGANGRKGIWERYLTEFFSGNILQILFGRGMVGRNVIGHISHNNFIGILFSFGIVGELIYFAIIISIIRNYVISKHINELVAFIPILLMSCSIETHLRIEFAVYLATALGTSVYYAKKVKISDKKACRI